MNTCLHIVSTSMQRSDALARAVSLAQPADAILLIEDGVYNAAENASSRALLADLPGGLTVYALSEDLAARAIPSRITAVQEVDYAGFVALVCQYHHSVSWD